MQCCQLKGTHFLTAVSLRRRIQKKSSLQRQFARTHARMLGYYDAERFQRKHTRETPLEQQ